MPLPWVGVEDVERLEPLHGLAHDRKADAHRLRQVGVATEACVPTANSPLAIRCMIRAAT